jgi:hypothetical protein
MDIRVYNRDAWDRQVAKGDRWTIPVGPEVIAAARRGEWQVVLTPTKPVPHDWFPPLADLEVLCLASGGGQQAPSLPPRVRPSRRWTTPLLNSPRTASWPNAKA